MITRLQQVTELLRVEDTEGLSAGAPDDEYDSEAEMITDRVGEAEAMSPNHKLTKDQVISVIADVWKEMFNLSHEQLALRREAFESIAARISP